MRRLGKPAFNRLGYSGLPYGFGSTLSKSYMKKVLRPGVGYDPASLIGFWLQNEAAGGVSFDHSGYGRDGAYTGVTLGQPGIGDGSTAAGYDGINDFNNIYGADLVNDNGLLNPGFENPGGGGADIWANYTETAGDGALANEVVIVHQGTDSCKMTSGLTSNTNVFGDAMVSVPGTVRRFRFYTYGDGVNAGRYAIYDITNGAYITPITSTGITAAAWGMVAAQYTVPVGCVSVRKEYWCPPVNGGICYFDASEDRRANAFLGDRGTIIVPAQVANVGVWTDATIRAGFFTRVDAANVVSIGRVAANNTIQFQYSSGGVLLLQTTGGLVNLDFAFYGMTWDIAAGATGEVRYYIGGVPSGATDIGLGTWVGDLNVGLTRIGAIGGGSFWSGSIGPVPAWSTALTPAAMAYVGVL